MKPLSQQSLYEILEVAPEAVAAEIEAAYERVRSLYAPGSIATYALMSPEEAAMLASRIEEAKTTLLDAEARARYDEALALTLALTLAPEPRPQSNGAAIARGPVPPVIPAAQRAPTLALAESPTEADDVQEKPRPAILLAGAARSAVPAAGAASRPPIRLEVEIAGAAPSPAPVAPEPPPPDVAEWTGDALRAAREARGITVQQIADRTKVTRHHIENIEAERFGALPAPVYLRGILLTVARELRLDGQKVARSYLERIAGSGPPPAVPKPR